jgi:hypothetical protein
MSLAGSEKHAYLLGIGDQSNLLTINIDIRFVHCPGEMVGAVDMQDTCI